MPSWLLLAFLALLQLQGAVESSSAVDRTLEAGAVGSAVVEATIAKIRSTCVFGDDKLFLRRLAYLASKDGHDQNAARNGGIWAVSDVQFNRTTTNSYITNIWHSFNIDWRLVSYSDLQKPLYSALAALIVILKNRNSIPRDVADQAHLWQTYFDNRGTTQMFERTATSLDQGCYYKSKMDIVFLLDASGSVGRNNFATMTDFVQKIIGGYEVGSNASRFGMVVFSSGTFIEVSLRNNLSKEQLLVKARELHYTSGGTSTWLGLRELKVLFSSEGRPDVPHIAIVVTDGQSGSSSYTLQAARELKNEHVTVFAIGVGSNTKRTELDGIASAPSCTHVFHLNDFSEFTAFRSELSKEACEAPIFLPQGSQVSVNLQPGVEQKCNFNVPNNQATVKMIVDRGRVTYLLSSEEYPNAAKYQQRVEVSAGQAGFVHVTQRGGSSNMFCAITGDPSVLVEAEITVLAGRRDACSWQPCTLSNTRCVPLANGGRRCDCVPGYTGDLCDIPPTIVEPGLNTPLPEAGCIKVNLGNNGFTVKTSCAGVVYTSQDICPTSGLHDTETHIQGGSESKIYLRPNDHDDSVFLMSDYGRRRCDNDTVSSGTPQILRPDGVNRHRLVERQFLVQIPSVGATVKFTTDTGNATLYAKFNGFPSADHFTWTTSAHPGQEGALYFPRRPSRDTAQFLYCLVHAPRGANVDVTVQAGDAIPCRSNPCQNGATCVDQVGNYICTCRLGFIGTHCDVNTLRIRGSGTSGVVEVHNNNMWSPICYSIAWNNIIAKVACRQLGLVGGTATEDQSFGGERHYHPGFSCNGGEESIQQCHVVSSFGCGRLAVLHCQEPTEVRLVGGDESAGRVEVKHNGTWGTICDDSWDNDNARIICQMLGKTGGMAIDLRKTVFGPGTGRIWLDDVTCNGRENDIRFCVNNGWGNENCNHQEDAAVICANENPCDRQPCENYGECLVAGAGFQCRCKKGFVDARCKTNNTIEHLLEIGLVDGNEVTGRVLFTTKDGHFKGQGKKMTICTNRTVTQNSTESEKTLAKVVCRLLDKSGGLPEVYRKGSQEEEDYVLTDVTCTGLESNMGLCQFSIKDTCTADQRFGVRCGSGSSLIPGGFQLAEGEFEPMIHDNYVPIYRKIEQEKEAAKKKAMKENKENPQHQPEVTDVKPVASQGEKTVFRKRRVCPESACHNGGTCVEEGDIWWCECPKGVSGLICEINQEMRKFSKVRLAGGDSLTGRVELLVNNTWGRVCAVDDPKFAEVVCRELGVDFGMRFNVKSDSNGDGSVVALSARCRGFERSLMDCDIDFINDTSSTCETEAAVSCNVYCSDSARNECPGEEHPVCGSDGVTWKPNECVHRKGACVNATEDSFLYIVNDNPCPSMLASSSRQISFQQLHGSFIMILLAAVATSMVFQ